MHDTKFICWNVFIYMGDDVAVPDFILSNSFFIVFCVFIVIFVSLCILTLTIFINVHACIAFLTEFKYA